MFTNNEQTQSLVATALNFAGISYDSLRFYTAQKITRVVIKRQLTVENAPKGWDFEQVIDLAKCGVYKPFRNEMQKIIDTLGAVNINEVYDKRGFLINCELCASYHVAWNEGQPTIYFETSPKMEILNSTVRTAEKQAQRQAARQAKASTAQVTVVETTCAITPDNGFVETEIETPIANATITPGQQIWMVVQFNGKTVRIKGEVQEVNEQVVIAKSNRTGNQYTVPTNLVFEEKPSVEVVEMAYQS